MGFILETLPGFYKVVSMELKLKGIDQNVEQIDNSSLLLQTTNDSNLVLKLKKLQTVNQIEKIITEIPYEKSIKEFRKTCRERLKDLEGIVNDKCIVSAIARDVKRKRLLIILRELQRLFKCRTTRSKADVELVVRFLRDRYVITLNVGTFQPLYRRWYTCYKSRASLHPLIAAAMSIIAGRGSKVLDPFCGSLTIPIEYLRMWNRSYVTCIDINKNTVLNSIRNAILSGTYDRMSIIVGDFFRTNLREIYDIIITDPPRGLRLSSGMEIYEKLVEKSINLLSNNGRIILVVFEKQLKSILRRIPSNLSINIPLKTIQGGYRVCILSISR